MNKTDTPVMRLRLRAMTVAAAWTLTIASALGGTYDVTGGVQEVETATLSGTNSVTKTGYGTLWLKPASGSNTYSGITQLDDGSLRAAGGVGLPAASRLYLSGLADTRPSGILESSGSFARQIGTNAGEVYWESRGGFAARGGPLSVLLEGGAALAWTNPLAGFNGQNLQLGSYAADSLVDLQNATTLLGNRGVYVWDNTNAAADVALISGPIADGDSTPRILTKYGEGTLWLSAANTFSSNLVIYDGTLRAIDGVGLPAGVRLDVQGQSDTRPNGVLESSGAFTRNIGTANGEIYWAARGGFAARGGPLAVSLEGGGPLNWGTATNGFNASYLVLGSRTADSVVDLQNPIQLFANRLVYAWDNPFAAGDFARLSGPVVNGDASARALSKYGDGLLELAATNGFTGGLYIYAGQVRVLGFVPGGTYVNYNGSVPRDCGLSGTGMVTALTVYTNGAVAPGVDAVGTLQATNGATLNPGAIYDWELGGGGVSDSILVTGNLTLGSTWTLRLRDGGGSAAPSDQHTIFRYSGTCGFGAVRLDDSMVAASSRWSTNGLQVLHDAIGKRIYVTGLSVVAAAPSRTLVWDGSGNGNWGDARWLGAPPDYPTSSIRAEVSTPANTVTVETNHSAHTLALSAGTVAIGSGSTLSAYAVDLSGGALRADGTLRVDAFSAGAASSLDVAGLVDARALTSAASPSLHAGGVLQADVMSLSAAAAVPSGAVLRAGTLRAGADLVVAAGGTLEASALAPLATISLEAGSTSLVGLLTIPEGAALSLSESNLAGIAMLRLDGGAIAAATPFRVGALDLRGGALTFAGVKGLAAQTNLSLSGMNLDMSGGALDTVSADVLITNNYRLTVDRALVAGSLTLHPGALVRSGATRSDRSVSLTRRLWLAGSNLDLSGGDVTVTGATVQVSPGLVLTADVPLSAASILVYGGRLSVPGPIAAETRFGLDAVTITNALTGAADLVVGEPRTADAVVTLTGMNTYSGKTQIARGFLRADETVGLPTGDASYLEFLSTNDAQPAVLETRGTFARDIGLTYGELFWGGHGGFAARDGNLAVQLEGGVPLAWGAPYVGFNGKALHLGSSNAYGTVELLNAVQFDSNNQVRVFDNPLRTTDIARLSGTLSEDVAGRTLRKEGDGTLWLSAANAYSGTTIIDDGMLRATDGAGLPAASRLFLSGSVDTRASGVLESSGSFTRAIGTNSGEVYWESRGGFAAVGGALTVALEAGATLAWTNPLAGFNGQALHLGSPGADALVDLQNDIALLANRSVYAWDNTNTASDVARLSGALANGDATPRTLTKYGDGTLWLSGANTFSSNLVVYDGALRALDGIGLPAGVRLDLQGQVDARPNGIFESSGLFTRNIGTANGEVYWLARGGFAAWGGPLTVSLEGGTQLAWGTPTNGFNGVNLQLGSRTASDVVDIRNDIGLGANRNIYVFDNLSATTDLARISGCVFNGGPASILYKYGDGILDLAGTNTYSAATYVYGGTLRVSGSMASTPIYVSSGTSGGTLEGTGAVRAVEVQALGVLAPGSGGPGRLNATGRIHMLAGSTYEWEVGPNGAYDSVYTTNTLLLDSTWTLRLKDAGGTARAEDQFDLFAYGGIIEGTYGSWRIDASLLDSNLWDAASARIVNDYANRRVYLTGLRYIGPQVSVGSIVVSEGDAGTAEASFTVTLAGGAHDVTVDFATSNGTAEAGADYVATNGTLAIAGGGEPSATVTVTVNGDTAGEWPSERFFLLLSHAVNARIAAWQAVGTIADDDGAATHWMKITFAGYSGTSRLVNIPVAIVLNEQRAGFNYAQFATRTGADLRFVNSNRTQLLNHEIERWTYGGDSYVWVQVPELSDSNTFIWANWGDPGATNPPAYTTNGATWSDSFLAVYHLNGESTAGRIPDSSPNRFDGTNAGCIDAPGRVAGAQNFDGMRRINITGISYAGGYNPLRSYTFQMWVRSWENSTPDYLLDIGTGRLIAALNYPAVGQASFYDQTAWRGAAGSSLNDYQWHLIEIVADGYASTGTIYVDGVAAAAIPYTPRDIGGGAWLGADYTGVGPYFDGLMDEVRISRITRSADWLRAGYLSQAAPDLFARFDPVEASASPLEVRSRPASAITAQSASIGGAVIGTGGEENPSVYVCWGLTDGGSDTGAWEHVESLGRRGEAGSFSTNISGLAAQTTYVFRCMVTNSAGVSWADPAESFTTRSGWYVSLSGDHSDGKSWATAFTNLQTALDAAGSLADIFVAGGRYAVTTQIAWRTSSVSIAGGHEGVGTPGARDPAMWPTIFTRTRESTNRIFYIADLTNGSLSGLTVTNGLTYYASNPPAIHPSASGAGLFITNCYNLVIEDCRIVRNAVFDALVNGGDGFGGGICSINSWVIMRGCSIDSNRVTSISTSNLQHSNGGGLADFGGEWSISNCTFIGNFLSADAANGFVRGGGLYLNGALSAHESVFRLNEAAEPSNDPRQMGDGIHMAGGAALFRNCLVANNGASAPAVAGPTNVGIYVAAGFCNLENCTVASNGQYGVQRFGGRVVVSNCIVWANGDDIAEWVLGGIDLRYSDVEDGDSRDVNGNISSDPRFADWTYYHPQSVYGNYGGGFLSGGAWGTSGSSSPTIDACLPSVRPTREPDPNGGIANMGYDGNTPVASLSHPTAVENRPASGIQTYGGTLNGRLTYIGSPDVSLWFYYGQSDGGTDAGAWETNVFAGVLSATGAVSAAARDLQTGVPYSFTLFASNAAGGTAWATPSLTFTPRLSPPEIANRGVINEDGPLATLLGEVTSTGGEDPAVYVCWGVSPGTADTSTWQHVEALGPQPGAFATNVALNAGSNYFYTCFATNSAGGAWASPTLPFGHYRIRYVAGGASGGGTGYTWADAFPSLQAALSSAASGRTNLIYVKAGDYVVASQLIWTNSNTILKGGYEGYGTPGYPDPSAAPTVIRNASSITRVMTLSGVRDSRIEDVTIAGGLINDNGGGLSIVNCSNVVIASCTFTNNVATDAGLMTCGGAIYALNSYGTLSGCWIERNAARSTIAGYADAGGGLYASGGRWTVEDTVVLYNKALSVLGRGFGAGACFEGGSHTVRNSLLVQNYARGQTDAPANSQGSAIGATNGSLAVESSTVAGNQLEGIRGSPAVSLRDCIIWQNGDDLVGVGPIDHCDVGNGDGAGTNGCLAADPRFEYGFYLGDGSPCVDTGSTSAAAAGLAGRTTRSDGAADSAVLDLGYHPASGKSAVCADLYVAPGGAATNSGTSWDSPFDSVTRALASARMGTHVHIASGLYGTNVGEQFPLSPEIAGLRLMGTNAADTTLTAAGSNRRVVRIVESPFVRLEGLTLTRGSIPAYSESATAGGAGLYVDHAIDMRITRCSLTNNVNSGGVNEYRQGGAIYGEASSVAMVDTVVATNRAFVNAGPWNGYAFGAGLYINGGTWALTNCVIVDNESYGNNYGGALGGGLYLAAGQHDLRNVLVARNNCTVRPFGGDGIYVACTASFRNVTVASNGTAAAFYGGPREGIRQSGGVTILRDSIVWGNGDDLAGTNALGALYMTNVAYTCIEDGDYSGTNGCMSLDPLFADASYFHLQSRGGVYEGGYFSGGTWGASLANSPAIDRADPLADYTQEPWPNGGRLNMGAYGNTPVASKTEPRRSALILVR